MLKRSQEQGGRPLPGDEHPLPLLVVLPQGELQQEDVRGVQGARSGRRLRGIQVGNTLNYTLNNTLNYTT